VDVARRRHALERALRVATPPDLWAALTAAAGTG
jgi:hypothetical protein